MKVSWSIGVLLVSAGGITDTAAAQRSISATVNTRLTYDSNVLGGRGVLRDPNVESADDWLLSPSLGVNVTQGLGRQSLTLTGSLGYDFYRRNSELNRENINLNGLGNLQGPAGCAGTLGLGYARRQSDPGDLILAPDGTPLVNVVNVQETRRYSAKVSCGREIGLRPGAGWVRSETRNSGIRRAQNVSSDTYTASLAYTRPSFGNLSLDGSYRDGRYPNREELVGAILNDGIEVYTAGLSYSREIGSRLGGSVSFGYSHVKPKSPLVPKFDGLSYSAAIRFQPSERLNTSLSASRSAEQSNLLAVSYTITTAFSFDGTYALSPRLSSSFGAGFSRRDFESTPLLPGALLGGADDTYDAHLGLRFKPRNRLSMGIEGAYRKRKSNGSSAVQLLDYESKRVSLSVGFEL